MSGHARVPRFNARRSRTFPDPWPLNPDPYQSLNVGSFFATAMFFNVTYTGRPSLYFG